MQQAAKWSDIEWGGTKSRSKREITLTIFGTNDTLVLPVETTTKVWEVKWMLGQKLGMEPEEFKFIVKTASSFLNLKDTDEVRTKVTVRGPSSWVRPKAQYPHPMCVIGAGHSALRQALCFAKEGNFKDFVLYDRLHRIGGSAWVAQANPTSKLQTELGVYHLQYDSEYAPPKGVPTWPSRSDLLDHFENVCEEFGLMPHIQLLTDVTKVDVVVNDQAAPWHKPNKQHYAVNTRRLDIEDEEASQKIVNFSGVCIYPGVLIVPKRVDYKGEDIFGGQIGYGMANEFDYKATEGDDVAVLGFGAFCIENIRSCVEHGAKKVNVICRRKNIAMPRVVSWFINQSLWPVNGPLVLESCMPMYDLLPNRDNPWDFHSVFPSKDRSTAVIRQPSRFGIGDLYFIAAYFGKAEVHIDSVKRMKHQQLLLESGRKVDVQHVVKCFGYGPDPTVDKVLGIKEMLGYFINSDHRRWCACEFTGIDAGKFGGTSFSPAAIMNSEFWLYFLNYPKDFDVVMTQAGLPRRKANKEKETMAHGPWDPRSGSAVGIILGSVVPGLLDINNSYGPLQRNKMRECHPLEDYVDECAAEWQSYGEMFKRQSGSDLPIPPYPYTHDLVHKYVLQNDQEGEAEFMKQMARAPVTN